MKRNVWFHSTEFHTYLILIAAKQNRNLKSDPRVTILEIILMIFPKPNCRLVGNFHFQTACSLWTKNQTKPRKPGFNSQSHVNLSHFPKPRKKGCFSSRHCSWFPSLACTILSGYFLSLGRSRGLRMSAAAGVQHLKNTPSSCCLLSLSKDSSVTQGSTEKHSLERSGTEILEEVHLGKYSF